jgi:hypothetical protein
MQLPSTFDSERKETYCIAQENIFDDYLDYMLICVFDIFVRTIE